MTLVPIRTFLNTRLAAFVAFSVTLASVAGGVAYMSTRPRLQSTNAWEGKSGGDGLRRYVVRVAEAPSVALGETPGGAEGYRRAVDAERLRAAQRELGPGRLGVDDAGRVAWIAGDRSRPVEGDGTEQAAPRRDPVADAVARLARTSGVLSVQPLRDGTVLVATKLSAADVRRLPDVDTVQASLTVSVAAVDPPDDPHWSTQWALRNSGTLADQLALDGADVGALDAWSRGRGEGGVVAVIDTGFATAHQDLAGALWTNQAEPCGAEDADGNGKAGDCHGWNFYANSPDVTGGADGWHGTLVAGVIAARSGNGLGGVGLAPAVKVMPLVVGAGTEIDLALAAEAIYYAVDHGAHVINVSFGGAVPDDRLGPLQAAAAYAREHGVPIVSAAGNDRTNRDLNPVYPASLDDPAVIAVGASTPTDTRARFSAYGPRTVELFAPGQNVLTTSSEGGYRLANGTSVAAPFVSAALALLRVAEPSLDVDDIRSRLLESVDVVAGLYDDAASRGRLSAAKLLRSVPSLRYRFGGLAGAPVEREFTTRVDVVGDAPAGPYGLRLRLVMRHGDGMWAVSGVPVGLGDAMAATDDDGTVTFDVDTPSFADGASFAPRLELPAGTFALVAQVVADGVAVGRPYAAPFVVSAAGTDTNQAPVDEMVDGQPVGEVQEPATAGGSGGGSSSGATSTPAEGANASGTSSSTESSAVAQTPSTASGNASTTAPSSSPSESALTQAPETSSVSSGTQTAAAPESKAKKSKKAKNKGSKKAKKAKKAKKTEAEKSKSSKTTGTKTASGKVCEEILDGSDAFGVTRVSPSVVRGGEVVTVNGKALPGKANVLLGGTPVSLMDGSDKMLSFVAPQLLPGDYSLQISEKSGKRASKLKMKVLYVEAGPSGKASQPVTCSGDTTAGSGTTSSGSTSSSTDGQTAPSSSDGSATGSATGDSSADAISGGGSSTGGSTASGGNASSGGASAPTIVGGPGGVRLVSGSFGSFASLWSVTDCTRGDCDGVRI